LDVDGVIINIIRRIVDYI